MQKRKKKKPQKIKAKREDSNNINTVLVSVSALALSAFPFNVALGQVVNINCGQDLFVGDHIACGTGSLVVRPDGGTNKVGCLVEIDAPLRGQCQISVTGGAPTRDVKVSFDPTPIMINKGLDNITVDVFRLQKATTGPFLPTLIYTPAEITAAVTVNVGARISFVDNQPVGLYSGNIAINADFN